MNNNNNNFFQKNLEIIIIIIAVIIGIGFYYKSNNSLKQEQQGEQEPKSDELENFDKNVQNEINLTDKKIKDFQNQLVLLKKELEPKLINSSQYFKKTVKQDEIHDLKEINEIVKKDFNWIISQIENEIESYQKYQRKGYLFNIKQNMRKQLIDNSKNRIKNNLLEIETKLNKLKNNIDEIKPKFKTNSENFQKIKSYVYSTKNDKSLLPSNLTEEEKNVVKK